MSAVDSSTSVHENWDNKTRSGKNVNFRDAYERSEVADSVRSLDMCAESFFSQYACKCCTAAERIWMSLRGFPPRHYMIIKSKQNRGQKYANVNNLRLFAPFVRESENSRRSRCECGMKSRARIQKDFKSLRVWRTADIIYDAFLTATRRGSGEWNMKNIQSKKKKRKTSTNSESDLYESNHIFSFIIPALASKWNIKTPFERRLSKKT